MTLKLKSLTLILAVLIFSSCASSSDVIHKGFIQKRKYKKGFSLSYRKKVESSPKKNNKENLNEGTLSNNNFKEPVDNNNIEKSLESKKELLSASIDNELLEITSPQKKVVQKSEEKSSPKESFKGVDNRKKKAIKRIHITHNILTISLVLCFLGGIGIPIFILTYIYARINILHYTRKWEEDNMLAKKYANRLQLFSIASNLIFITSLLLAYFNYPCSSCSPEKEDNLILLGIFFVVLFVVSLISAFSNYLKLYKNLDIKAKAKALNNDL